MDCKEFAKWEKWNFIHTNSISITAQNAGINFVSENQYKDSVISLAAADNDFINYEPPVYPNYFTKTEIV